jgi:hypothetical protein
MPMIPRADVAPNTFAHQTEALVKATGFREYDARWVLDEGINLLGIQALGLALGSYIHEVGAQPRIVVGHDYRSYSLNVKQALTLGLMQAGARCSTSAWRSARWPTSPSSTWTPLRRHGDRQPQRERLDRGEDGRAAPADLRPGGDGAAARADARRRGRASVRAGR